MTDRGRTATTAALVVMACLAAVGCEAPTPAANVAARQASATGAPQWLGRWTGPEGLFLEIWPGPAPDRYRLVLKDTLDAQASYIAHADGPTLVFMRQAKTVRLRHGTGRETGFTDLAGQTDCVIAVPGVEGYCRFPDTANALPLTRGLYVADGTTCADPPFAAIRTYNGAAFSDPHTHACKSRLVAQHGLTFHIATRCTMAGTGPAPRQTSAEIVTVTDATHFRIRPQASDAAADQGMHYCAPARLPASLRRPAER